jgi:hypothetical protein
VPGETRKKSEQPIEPLVPAEKEKLEKVTESLKTL